MNYDITFHPSWWNKNAGIDFSQSFFDDAQTRIKADIKMRKVLFEKFGEYGIGEQEPEPRPLLGTNFLAAGYLHSEILGCKIEYAKANSPVVHPMNLDVSKINDLKFTGLKNSAVWERTQSQIDYLKSEYGSVLTYVNLMGVQNVAMDILGQNLMIQYYMDPDGVRKLLDEITKCIIEVGLEFKKFGDNVSCGVTSIMQKTMPNVYLTSNCTCEMISNDHYEEFLLEYDNKLADAFGSFGVHHCGASMEHVIEGYSKLKNLDFIEVGAGSDVNAIRKKLPNIFMNLRVSPVALSTMNKEEMKEHVSKLVEAGTNNNKQVSVSCVGIDDKVTDEQLLSFLSACKNINA